MAPEVRDMVLLAPSRGSVVKCSLSHYLTTWRCLNPTPASPTQPLRARVGGRRCAPHYTLYTRVHTFTPKAQQGGSLAIQTCDDLGPFPNRGGRSPSKRATIMASAGGEEGHTTRTCFTIHFDPALPHACSRGGVWDRGFLGVCVSAGRYGSARVRTLTSLTL